jgi:small-conductance mechanosensitive channel
MNRAINAILGIGVAIVVFLFFILSFKIVYQEPQWDACWSEYPRYFERQYEENLTEEQILDQEQQEAAVRACEERTNAARSAYSQKVFYSAIIVGMLLILAIIPLLAFANIAAGIGASGIALFVYGLSVGWNSTSEIVKLVLMFIAVVIVIGLAIWLNLKKDKKRTISKKRK